MIIFNSIQQLKNHLNSIRNQKKIIGFVPTMGALHFGHISLVQKAKAECDMVVCSIFVNPTQFNDLSDLDKYPRTFDADCQILESDSCDIVFAPETMEMYSAAELELKKLKKEDKSWTESRNVDFGLLEKVMEGAQRPGHFNGVAQVVSKLFRIVEPHKAYFGQKDFQQLAIIKSMVKQLEMPVQIIACPIIREPNGLAMSSRNERLTKQEREIAALISQTLFKIQDLYPAKNVAELKTFGIGQISKEPLMQLEYLEIADADTLQPITNFEQSKSAVVCIAVTLGAVRLIDNVVLY
ncbi:MAG TPA: pantoate--beta-alanine ligase [Bacteroidia bacterium]|jgi:pantoate--beta-alanine ligase